MSKIKMVGKTSVVKCKALMGSAVKGLKVLSPKIGHGTAVPLVARIDAPANIL